MTNPADPIPIATYRLQLHREFGLPEALALVPYLARLGITHLYLSPILRARPGSLHGYDVVDPRLLNPELGTETDLRNLVSSLRRFGLSLLLDIVPNHMATSYENPYWRDVLTYGTASPYAGWFDIDWRRPDPELWGRVLLPVLGAPRARVLEQEQVCVAWSDGRFRLRYFDQIFPLDPATVGEICSTGLHDLMEILDLSHPARVSIPDILARLRTLPSLRVRRKRRVEIDRARAEEWLAELSFQVVQSPRIEQWAQETAARFGGGPEGRARLTRVLERQTYRLVFWRRAAHLLNYRRFFDINELISVRQEDPQVFTETHAALLRWVEQNLVDGFRIDHIDGLRDPSGYLAALAGSLGRARSARPRTGFPVFVEKILAPGEPLSPDWPVQGTTGYEFLNQVEDILTSPAGFARMEDRYRRLVRRPVRFAEVAAWGKRRILHHEMSAQVRRLAHHLLRIAQRAGNTFSGPAMNRSSPRFLRDLTHALVEVAVALPVYRTYLNAAQGRFGKTDAAYLRAALQTARQGARSSPQALDLLEQVFLPENPGNPQDPGFQERLRFVGHFQQLTSPAAAKGIEDTALYAYVPLVSRNEVGGVPEAPGENAPQALHEANRQRAARWPRTMLAVTTHDTKRTADVRARLDVLSEVPDTWWSMVNRWRRMHHPLRTRVSSRLVPGPSTEYLFYQSAAGIWPAPPPHGTAKLPGKEEREQLAERLTAYMIKAVREAKRWTSWTRINETYESAVVSFVRKALCPEPDGASAFLSEMQGIVGSIARPGYWNSLCRTLIQLASPGSPDIYQGDEVWNFALVDPDNRRPVDFLHRQQLLDEVVLASEDGQARREFLRRCSASPEDGRIKLYLIHQLLQARRSHPALFGSSSYEPLEVEGPLARHVFGFIRTSGKEAVLAASARLTARLSPSGKGPPLGPDVWPEENAAVLPPPLRDCSWSCLLTGDGVTPSHEEQRSLLTVSRLFAHSPVALLIGRS